MRVHRLLAQNYKRLEVADIHFPDNGVFNITGRNGQGKTSVLDAIWAAFGSLKAVVEVPIRQGEAKGEIRVECDDMVVIRRFGTNSRTGAPTSELIVENAQGLRYPSPQKLLDAFWQPIAFDPLEFMRLAERPQYEQLRRLVALDVDIDALDAANRTDYDARREANREADRLNAQAAGIHFPEGLPENPPDVGELTRELQRAGDGNAELEQERARRARLSERAAEVRQQARVTTASIDTELAGHRTATARQLARLDDDIADLERRLGEAKRERSRVETEAESYAQSRRGTLEAEAAGLNAQAEAIERELAEADPLPATVDTTALLARIEEAQRLGAQIAERNRHRSLIAEAGDYARRAAALTEAMAEREGRKRAAIEQAKMPIEGLGFTEGRVTYRDLPLAQASAAEQLRVSTSIAMAANPTLRLIVIRDGAILDDDSLAEIQGMAAESDYLCLIESIDPTGKIGVVMEDGKVAEVLTPETAAHPRTRTRRQPDPEPETGTLSESPRQGGLL